MIKPNFLIVGASKCGTTALYYYLKQHPEISFPKIKEPKYFSSIFKKFPHKGIGDSSVDRYAVRDYKSYQNLFRDINNTRIGEASPDTLYYHKETAKKIKELLGDIPIIITLRDPAKRAFSAYMYLKRDSREKLSFNEALDSEEHRRSNNWDFIWHYKNCGLYFDQVKTFFNEFSQVKVFLQEDLQKRPESVLSDLYKFLGVNPEFKTDFSVRHNESGVPNNAVSKFLLSRDNIFSTTIREIMKLIIPRKILEKVASKSLKKETMSNDEYQALKSFFYDDICNLEKLINADLSSWK